jgi:hypothetical protein
MRVSSGDQRRSDSRPRRQVFEPAVGRDKDRVFAARQGQIETIIRGMTQRTGKRERLAGQRLAVDKSLKMARNF